MPPSLDAEEDEGREPDARRSVRQEVLDQLRLSAPICLGRLANRFMATTSTVIVGHLGEKELAAVGLAVSLANVSGYSILVGIATMLQTTTGQAFGARNFEEVSLSLQRCTLLCLVMLGLIAALWLSSEPLLLAVGQEKAVAALAARYLKYLLPGVCCYLVTQCSQNWLAAQRMTGVQATGSLILAAVYLPLCWTLVHPLKLGFIGAAVATSLSNAILALWMVFKTCRALRSELPRSWQGFSRLAFTRWAPFLKLAVPNFLMISEWWASEIIVLMSGTLPEAEVSLTAMAVFANTFSICFMPPLSWGMAANTRVSNELGAGRPRAAKFASQVNFCFGLCMVLTIALGVLLGRRAWLRLFTSELEVLDYADPVMSICSIYLALAGMCTVASGSLKGCGRQLILAPVVIFAYYAVPEDPLLHEICDDWRGPSAEDGSANLHLPAEFDLIGDMDPAAFELTFGDSISEPAMKKLVELRGKLGALSNECSEQVILDVVCLAVKKYSILMSSLMEIRKAKGVPKSVRENSKHADYLRIHEENATSYDSFMQMRSSQHQVYIVSQRKKSFDVMLDKSFQLTQKYCRPSGHWRNAYLGVWQRLRGNDELFYMILEFVRGVPPKMKEEWGRLLKDLSRRRGRKLDV